VAWQADFVEPVSCALWKVTYCNGLERVIE